MIIKAQYSIENDEVKALFEKFLLKLPARNIAGNRFEVDLDAAKLLIGEALHVINAMIDRQTDTVVVKYRLLGKAHTSILGKKRKSKA